ncbi:vWA domain-containing protein [Flavobacterium rakeshii]|uniref:vWA domain-containing protein n=1 Tax=Flavobacterium rakeshii TaxID=1038845 RepID=UPI002E7BD7E0|nr:vWA domain-containing protein [Flavobacterium rakeshii]MEE1900004.1 vWA domain-containing protein [Flavobacterium rakeshii]
MTTSTVLLIIVSALVAFALSFYQYLFKAKKKSPVFFFLAFLRFITLMAVFLLLINPVVTKQDYETVKTPLPVLLDNSQSVKELGQDSIAKLLSQKITSNKALNEKYDVQLYTFDESFEVGKEPNFTGKQTHIDQAVQNLKQFYRNTSYPVILLTDGNQTIGNDYVYSFQQNTSVYPVVLGDTTVFPDLKINQLNANKYAFLKNKFPVEVFLQYNGTKTVNAVFSVQQGNNVLSKQNITFTKDKKAQAVTVLLDADKVGVQTYRAVLSSPEQEKNKYNNIKNFAVEVIDQRSEVAIVSTINHPDLGALKRAIETNQQRRVTIIKPNDVKSLNDYNVLVLYQPNATFKGLLDMNANAGLNTWIITGMHTDFNLLNQYQQQLSFKMTNQKEDYLASYISSFNLFATDDIGFEQFPPLEQPFGNVKLNSGTNTLLQARIRNVETDNPLLVFSESGSSRKAFLLGENIWKWRLETHVNNKSFEEFDVFTDKIIQYLATNSKRKSLVVNHERFYNSGEPINITAQFFNKNYEFDENARLTIVVKGKESDFSKTYDFLKGNNEYKVNMDGLPTGQYTFTVKENNSNTTYVGSFEVLDFEIEKQFVNPDLNRLLQTADNTNGKVYFPSQTDELIDFLAKNENYKETQKVKTTKSPLIDWITLLIILCVSLATEWFTRKYNGLL